MSKLEQLDREQLKKLDQESLIGVILILQQQLTEQQELIQAVAGSTGERQSQQWQAAEQRWSAERQAQESASRWATAARWTTGAQRTHPDAGG